MSLAEVAAAAFDVGAVASVEPHPTGHINDAYLVTTDRGRYLLQRLNPSVFKYPDALMANVVAVTAHLRGNGEPTLTLVPTHTGDMNWRDDTAAVWRTYDYVEGAHPLDVHTPDDATIVGRAFGRFHRAVADLDPATLGVSIPCFHDPGRRADQLARAIETDREDRLRNAAALVDAIWRLRPEVHDTALDDLPIRVAHNDAKAANLLVDDIGSRDPLVVDLDTVMAGSPLWDVGDMIRSSTGTADEEARTVRFDVDRYRALIDGWKEEVNGLLTPEELNAVPRAGLVATFEQAMRFLTDHLLGDVYFRVSRPDQNLERAENQVTLLRSMVSAL
ncbi:MAG: aminoglycoside phosphotransferase family protein [Acidimicrobiia bacterium]|nr:aminoglycoside phosphotransferase family protein [Acidimicrobiia bacterium]